MGHLQRLMTALRYFEVLRRSKDRDTANALFSDLRREKYPQFLSDYIHFTREHRDDAEDIREYAQAKYGLSACSISHCKAQRREGRTRTRTKTKSDSKQKKKKQKKKKKKKKKKKS